MSLTRLPAHMIRAKGAENASVLEVQNERLSATTPSDAIVSEIESGLFDATQGVLTLTFYNGTTMRIPGWPTADKIPAGATGPQGLAGKDGKTGKDGRDGAAGSAGCAGPQGQIGQTGPKGETGRTGQQGPQGPTGPQGPEGLQGPVGPTGPQGPMGPQGPRGEQGPQGKPGPKGPEGFMNIVVSNTEPKEEDRVDGMLWVSPSADWSCDGYRPPECPECPPPTICQFPELPDQKFKKDSTYTQTQHYLGPNPGTVRVICVAGAVPNSFTVKYRGTVVADSGGKIVSSDANPLILEFHYEPIATDNTIEITVQSSSATDGWWYTLSGPKL